MTDPERLLVRAPNWVGDVVLSLPALRDLRRSYPTARLEVLARPWVAELYQAVPGVDAVVESRGHAGDVEALRGRYDLGVLLPNSFGTALVLWRAGIPERWGYATDGRGALLTRGCRVPAGVRGRSQVYYYRAMLEGLGLAVEGPPDASLACPEEWAARGRALLGGDRPWIGVNPGAFYGTAKRWRPERFAAAADLVARRTGASVAIVGGAAERPLGEAVAGQLQSALARPVRRDDAGRPRRRPEEPAGPADERLGAHAPRRRSRHPARGGLRLDRLDGDLARLRPRARRARGDGVRAVPPAGVPDRPPLHDPRRRPWRGLRRAGAGRVVRPRKRPAIFMDRDGTLSHEVGYVNHPSRFRLYPWTADAVRAINRAGWLAVVVTNQAGVARGYFPESVFEEVQQKLREGIEAGGARFDAVYACLHHPSVGPPSHRMDCDCRKPRPGMLRRAEKELGADLQRSWVVGDRHGDLQLAWNVGARGALVKSGYGLGELTYLAPGWSRQPDLVAENLLEAVERILGREAE